MGFLGSPADPDQQLQQQDCGGNHPFQGLVHQGRVQGKKEERKAKEFIHAPFH
jgi:hypothetical protein